jgi:hypothetical protein
LTRAAILLAASLFAGAALAQGTGLPGTGLPGTGLPGTGLPGTGLPGTSLPGMGGPGAAIPGLGTDEGTSPSAPNPNASGDLTPSSKIYTGTGLPPLPGSRQPITCPTVHGGRLIASSDVYDGSPMRGTLMPQRNGKWNLPPHDWPGNAYFISCEYGYDRPPLGIRLPQRISACERPKGDPTQVACH